MTLDDRSVLALQELLLLGRRVGVTLIVTGTGDAGGGAPVVLVDVLWIAAELLVDAPSVGALALPLSLSITF